MVEKKKEQKRTKKKKEKIKKYFGDNTIRIFKITNQSDNICMR